MNWLFFLDQRTAVLLIITCLALTVAMAAEMFWPRRTSESTLGWRWSNNLGLALITWYVSHLANYALILALVYWTHLIFHHVPWLWPLHAVHHSDVDVDISTSYRHHPLEPLIFMPLLTPVILLLGIPMEVLFTYHAITIFVTVFSHSNFRLPPVLDSYLSKIVVTPDFHRVHHSSERYYTNSNYGGIVPWFDYLFGTAKKRSFKDHETFELGLEHGRDRSANRLDKMLLSPLHRVERTDELT